MLKILAKSIRSVFKVTYVIFESYSNKCRYVSSVNTFWTDLNNDSVITRIKNLNKQGKVESIMTFDFSTLYTKKLHRKLVIKKLDELNDFCFDGGSHKYIIVNRFGAK